jgi:hypothetical protein
MLLAFLLCFTGTVSGAYAPMGTESRVGVSGPNPDIHAYVLGSLELEPQRGDTILGYDPVSGVVFYVRQNPWTKFDPLGLETIKDYENEIDETRKASVREYENQVKKGNIVPLAGGGDFRYPEAVGKLQEFHDDIEESQRKIDRIVWATNFYNNITGSNLDYSEVDDSSPDDLYIGAGVSGGSVNAFDIHSRIQAAKIGVAVAGIASLRGGKTPGSFLRGSVRPSQLAARTTVYRVEGLPNTRITIGESGQVAVQGDQMLFLNFGDKARAEAFLAQRMGQGMPGAQMKSFEVPSSFLDDLRSAAVPESMAKQFPGRPLVVDPTKAADQFGLRPDQIKSLQDAIIQGSGRAN